MIESKYKYASSLYKKFYEKRLAAFRHQSVDEISAQVVALATRALELDALLFVLVGRVESGTATTRDQALIDRIEARLIAMSQFTIAAQFYLDLARGEQSRG